jgi:hypothetical protein
LNIAKSTLKQAKLLRTPLITSNVFSCILHWRLPVSTTPVKKRDSSCNVSAINPQNPRQIRQPIEVLKPRSRESQFKNAQSPVNQAKCFHTPLVSSRICSRVFLPSQPPSKNASTIANFPRRLLQFSARIALCPSSSARTLANFDTQNSEFALKQALHLQNHPNIYRESTRVFSHYPLSLRITNYVSRVPSRDASCSNKRFTVHRSSFTVYHSPALTVARQVSFRVHHFPAYPDIMHPTHTHCEFPAIS